MAHELKLAEERGGLLGQGMQRVRHLELTALAALAGCGASRKGGLVLECNAVTLLQHHIGPPSDVGSGRLHVLWLSGRA